MLTVKSLYPHLNDAYIKQNQKFCDKYSHADTQTESDRLLVRKLNEEADVVSPVMSNGWRINDIDAINKCNDPRLYNILLSRLVSQNADDINHGLSDDELLARVVPRNLMASEVNALAAESVELTEKAKQAFEEMRHQIASLEAQAKEPAPAQSEPTA